MDKAEFCAHLKSAFDISKKRDALWDQILESVLEERGRAGQEPENDDIILTNCRFFRVIIPEILIEKAAQGERPGKKIKVGSVPREFMVGSDKEKRLKFSNAHWSQLLEYLCSLGLCVSVNTFEIGGSGFSLHPLYVKIPLFEELQDRATAA